MGNVASTLTDNPYLVMGIALAAYTGGASLGVTGAGATAAGATAAGGAAASGAAAAGGFSWTTAAMVGSTALQVQQQAHMAEQLKIDADAQKKQEEFQARDAEIDRRNRLLHSVARQNVFSASGGVESFTGTPEHIMKESERVSEGEGLRIKAGSQYRKSAITRRGQSGASKARINVAASLLDTGERVSRRG